MVMARAVHAQCLTLHIQPGGLISTHEDTGKRKPKTHSPLITMSDTTFPTLVLANDLACFSAETPGFFSRSSLTKDS